ncbi:fibronectin type III domain-containing protein [Lysobacter sp. K5869]|uniref:Ig-like domain-containing protein n=1 Tax=Lysobacter sp. K5869 TaxID=2820808 RepID=UPI001C061B85|nr:glycosyl hydrolase family 18 protein [Lysobacter sp. K5869]QWP77150.1 fibronectin type III domain-containing protein [Lysobacter sp. K5869]
MSIRSTGVLLSGFLLAAGLSSAHAQSVSCAGIADWNASTIYNAGSKLVYQGRLYQATTQIWNTPPTHCPSCGYYQDLGACSAGGNTPPTVALTTPANGATFSAGATISVAANAADANGSVAQVQFFRGSTSLGIDTTSPYSATWTNAAAGNYAITAVATDNEGASTTSSAANITVNAGTPDTTAPSVPAGLAATSVTSSSINLSWSASTDNPGGSGVAGYDVYRDGTLVGSPTGTSFSNTGLTASTAYTFRVRARDNAGNASAQGTQISATTSAGGGDNTLPRHALVGYWHNFTNPSGATFPISQVSNDFDVIVVAFGDDAGNGAVSFTVDPGAGTEAQFKADVAAARARGKKVVLSLGGQNGTVTLNNATQVANFVNSMEDLIRYYGFDGVDIDLESGAGVYHGAAVQTNLVTAIKQLNTRIGPSFYLSMAPEHPYVQGGFVAYSGIWGAYLPIIDGLRQELDLIHVQYYNNGAMYSPYSQNGLPEGSVDMLVGASLMLIEGFRTNNNTGVVFNGLRPDQVAFGLPSGPSSANSGQASAATIANALNCLTRLQNCGTIRPQQAYPTFRGVMTWSVNWDRHDGFNFSKPVRATLNALP